MELVDLVLPFRVPRRMLLYEIRSIAYRLPIQVPDAFPNSVDQAYWPMRTTPESARILKSVNLVRRPWYFATDDNEHEGSRGSAPGRFGPVPSEDLPYKVELWNQAKTAVEQVLAVTANGSIGYAAYYAATREHPDRYITLRHKNSIVSRWNGPTN
jgi:hypothetical protein